MAWIQVRKLDILQLMDDISVNLGVKVERSRLWIGLINVCLAAVAVSIVVTIGFIGLIAPHASRLLIGPRHHKLVPVSKLLGAFPLVAADLIGRTVFAPRKYHQDSLSS
ncbi:ABC-type Fe3+-siderophore transport system permease subunit [Paenibacillus baekrokdamisoli]|uniref:iron chelate uptake ABC transporter family permease subunit n=1 Tax=Paenibacillus baekrokdamisoli TaxID=1712516 RepID=UPI0018083E04|nr:ABC-type Fe3+-siderophore transport system permease subunit [Paenibacillus baekrokdamisoli]